MLNALLHPFGRLDQTVDQVATENKVVCRFFSNLVLLVRVALISNQPIGLVFVQKF